jgi:pimeloyl-ACP methyl ester carboxylesterase
LRLASSLRLSEEQVEGFIRGIRAPVLLVLGEQGMGGSGAFDHRLDWLRDCRVERLPGRHHLHMEQPEPVAASVRAFLEADQI